MDAVGFRTLRELLEYRADTQPESPFVLFDDVDGGTTSHTYGDFDRAVNRAAGMLRALGIARGDKVNLHLANCVEFLVLWFAAAKIGAVIMPTNVAATADELEYLIGHSECRLIFTQPAYLDVARDVQGRCAAVDAIVVCGGDGGAGTQSFEDLVSTRADTRPGIPCGPEDEAGMLYTSGTTSRPKGVLVTNANYIYAGETVAKILCLTPDDRHLAVLPLFHGNAQYYSTMSTLVTGASMVLSSRFSASRYFDQAIRHRCTVASARRAVRAKRDGASARRVAGALRRAADADLGHDRDHGSAPRESDPLSPRQYEHRPAGHGLPRAHRGRRGRPRAPRRDRPDRRCG
jgi:crotonobetaine/carnitine-CoA ligase